AGPIVKPSAITVRISFRIWFPANQGADLRSVEQYSRLVDRRQSHTCRQSGECRSCRKGQRGQKAKHTVSVALPDLNVLSYFDRI
ncbi:MAG: hypothetical protein WAL14_05555, partial [Pseudolabrys sp.]